MNRMMAAPSLPENAHALPGEEILARLDTRAETGLTAQEAKSRLARYGPNTLRVRRPVTLLRITPPG